MQGFHRYKLFKIFFSFFNILKKELLSTLFVFIKKCSKRISKKDLYDLPNEAVH